MRPAVTLLVTIVFATIVLASVQTDLQARWTQFKTQYGKSYDSVEENKRFSIFQANLRRVLKMNAEHGEPYPFGTTQFMDLTPAEFKAKYLMKNIPQNMPAAPKRPSKSEVTYMTLHARKRKYPVQLRRKEKKKMGEV